MHVNNVTYVDSHSHIHLPEFLEQLPEIINRMTQNFVSHTLCVSLNLLDFPQVLKLIERYSCIYGSVGVHPNYIDIPEPNEDQLITLAAHPRVIAIGETGLDYHFLKSNFTSQHQRFRTHIRVSRKTRKPLIVHTRLAAADTLRILREEGASPEKGGVAGVIHCFTESQEIADEAIALGFYISFSGIVTFKNAKALQAVARTIPLECMLIETDSPYLAPVPFRGRKINEPSLVSYIAAFIAKLRGISVAEVGYHISNNFFKLFKITK